MEEKKLTGYPSIDKPWLKYYTEEQINAPLPYLTAYEYLKKQNAKRLDYLAIDSEEGKYTYRELFAQIDATAAALWAMGIQKGKTVLSMFPVLPHESFLLYGIDAVGAALYQIPPRYTAPEVCNYINGIDADLFFTFDFVLTPELEQMVYQRTKVRHIIVVNFKPLHERDERTIAWVNFMAKGEHTVLPEIQRDPAKDVLLFTSTGGSTGEPKCVMYSDNAFNLTVHQTLHSPLPFQPKEKWLRLWPLFSASAAIANHHLPLCNGMLMVLRDFACNIKQFPEIVWEVKPNHLVLVPQMFDAMVHSELLKNQDLSFIISAACGGAAITPKFEERVLDFFKAHGIKAFVGHAWGCSESGTTGAYRTSHETAKVGSVGAPLAMADVSVFDVETGNECTYNQEGELCIRTPSMMLGYLNDPDATQKVLRKHSDGTVWVHTGDIGSMDESGIVTVKGRLTRTIFVFPGDKLYPQHMESELSKVKGVQDVIVCGVPSPEGEGFYCPVCFIVPEKMNEAEAVTSAVERYCAENYPKASCPKRIFIKELLPLNKGNKPDILALEKEAIAAMEG